MISKTDRNEELVALRDKNPQKWSFPKLATKYKISVMTAYEIYHREKAKENSRYKVPPSIARRYDYLEA